MTLFAADPSVFGITPTCHTGPVDPAVTGFIPPIQDAAVAEANAFGRLVELYRSNESLLADLSNLDSKLARARTYLLSPSGNPALAEAQILRLKGWRSAVLTALRANRVAAREFLGNGRAIPVCKDTPA